MTWGLWIWISAARMRLRMSTIWSTAPSIWTKPSWPLAFPLRSISFLMIQWVYFHFYFEFYATRFCRGFNLVIYVNVCSLWLFFFFFFLIYRFQLLEPATVCTHCCSRDSGTLNSGSPRMSRGKGIIRSDFRSKLHT